MSWRPPSWNKRAWEGGLRFLPSFLETHTQALTHKAVFLGQEPRVSWRALVGVVAVVVVAVDAVDGDLQADDGTDLTALEMGWTMESVDGRSIVR